MLVRPSLPRSWNLKNTEPLICKSIGHMARRFGSSLHARALDQRIIWHMANYSFRPEEKVRWPTERTVTSEALIQETWSQYKVLNISISIKYQRLELNITEN